jgi:hypothetical protein
LISVPSAFVMSALRRFVGQRPLATNGKTLLDGSA